MKANELMIGDWCKMKLSFGTTWYTDKVGCINPDNEMEYEPIPLTPEILEKNPRVKDIGYWDKFGEHTIFRLYLIPVINQWYVHGLQHSLRLFGLIDLADNFQV